MGTGNNCLAAIEMLTCSRVVERGCSRVEFHVTGVDTRAVDPWVVEIILTTFNEKDSELWVEVGKPSGNNATGRATYDRSRVRGAMIDITMKMVRIVLPPATMISTSSGIVILDCSIYNCNEYESVCPSQSCLMIMNIVGIRAS